MSSRQLEEAQEARRDEHVARELGIEVEDLTSYELEEAGGGIVWRVLWQDRPPEGVEAEGAEGSQWTDINPLYEPDEP